MDVLLGLLQFQFFLPLFLLRVRLFPKFCLNYLLFLVFLQWGLFRLILSLYLILLLDLTFIDFRFGFDRLFLLDIRLPFLLHTMFLYIFRLCFRFLFFNLIPNCLLFLFRLFSNFFNYDLPFLSTLFRI